MGGAGGGPVGRTEGPPLRRGAARGGAGGEPGWRAAALPKQQVGCCCCGCGGGCGGGRGCSCCCCCWGQAGAGVCLLPSWAAAYRQHQQPYNPADGQESWGGAGGERGGWRVAGGLRSGWIGDWAAASLPPCPICPGAPGHKCTTLIGNPSPPLPPTHPRTHDSPGPQPWRLPWQPSRPSPTPPHLATRQRWHELAAAAASGLGQARCTLVMPGTWPHPSHYPVQAAVASRRAVRAHRRVQLHVLALAASRGAASAALHLHVGGALRGAEGFELRSRLWMLEISRGMRKGKLKWRRSCGGE